LDLYSCLDALLSFSSLYSV